MVLRLKTRESRSLPGLLKAMPSMRMDQTIFSYTKTTGPWPNQGPLPKRPFVVAGVETITGRSVYAGASLAGDKSFGFAPALRVNRFAVYKDATFGRAECQRFCRWQNKMARGGAAR